MLTLWRENSRGDPFPIAFILYDRRFVAHKLPAFCGVKNCSLGISLILFREVPAPNLPF